MNEQAPIEGSLNCRLFISDGGVDDVSVRYVRPLALSGLFIGRTPQEAVSGLPRLYSVCKSAQATAAVGAAEAALGVQSNPQVGKLRTALVCLETAREHVLRILIDWPAFLNLQPDAAAVRSCQRIIAGLQAQLELDGQVYRVEGCSPDWQAEPLAGDLRKLKDFLAASVYQTDIDEWLNLCSRMTSLADWVDHAATGAAEVLRLVDRCNWHRAGEIKLYPLPAFSDEYFQRKLCDDSTRGPIQSRGVGGQHYETSCFTRLYDSPQLVAVSNSFGNGLFARQIARLVELARAPDRIAELLEPVDREMQPAARVGPVPPGVGIARVQAARGLLVHRMVVAGGRIRQYQILAPTEWNFSEGGVVSQMLKNLRGRNEQQLRAQAALLIDAVDPCVACHIDVNESSHRCA